MKGKTHDLNHDLTFSAHTIDCMCHSIRSMFRVLVIYSFGSFLFLGPDVLTKESLTIPWGMQHRFLHQIRTLQFHSSLFSKVFVQFSFCKKATKVWHFWQKSLWPSPEECNIVFYIKLEHYNFILLYFQKYLYSSAFVRRPQRFGIFDKRVVDHPLRNATSFFTSN